MTQEKCIAEYLPVHHIPTAPHHQANNHSRNIHRIEQFFKSTVPEHEHHTNHYRKKAQHTFCQHSASGHQSVQKIILFIFQSLYQTKHRRSNEKSQRNIQHSPSRRIQKHPREKEHKSRKKRCPVILKQVGTHRVGQIDRQHTEDRR